MYQREDRWELHFLAPNSISGKVVEMVSYPRSKERIAQVKQKCREHAHEGYKFLWCKKMYPASYEKHGHDLELVRNRTYNLMSEMDMGETSYNAEEYARLESLNKTATRLLELCTDRITWLIWDDYKEFRDLCFMASNIRADSCERCGRYDLIPYC